MKFCEALNDIPFPGLIDLFLSLTIYILVFTFVQGRSDFRWENAELLTCKYLENLAYSSLGKMEGCISKTEKHYLMATLSPHEMRLCCVGFVVFILEEGCGARMAALSAGGFQ